MYSKNLLLHFVRIFKDIYGPQNVSHNVHALIHLTDDVSCLGTQDCFPTFRFENYMQNIKNMIRTDNKLFTELKRIKISTTISKHVIVMKLLIFGCIRCNIMMSQYSLI